MDINRAGSQPSVPRNGALVQASAPARVVVWMPPGEKHWHGASPKNAMTHIAVQESLDGKTVEWVEKVTDEQYGK